MSAYERNKFYLNVDGHKFFDASFASNTDIDSDSRSAISSDFNDDGKPDLLVGSAGGGPLKLFLNQFENKNKFLVQFMVLDVKRYATGVCKWT